MASSILSNRARSEVSIERATLTSTVREVALQDYIIKKHVSRLPDG